MTTVNYLVYFTLFLLFLILLLLIAHLLVGFFPNINKVLSLFDKKTPLFEKITFYITSVGSIASLIIALVVYNDSLISSKTQSKINDSTRVSLERVVKLISKQTETLDSSRVTLQAVVKSSLEQQTVLDASLKISRDQLNLVQASTEREQLIVSYVPRITFDIYIDSLHYTERNITKWKIEKAKADVLLIKINKKQLNTKIEASIGISNTGQIAAKNPLLLLEPTDSSAYIEKISKADSPFDYFDRDHKTDIIEFFDYYDKEIVPYSLTAMVPSYKFYIIPVEEESVIRVDVTTTNAKTRTFIIFISSL